MASIARIKKVQLREIWRKEATDFTTWLEKNIDILDETLNLKLTAVEREKRTGPFQADLWAEDRDNNAVVIECQLEKTNHDHLGKIITYLSNLDAKKAIWICKDAYSPHEKAITWLNESTPPDTSFYLVKVEAIKIGDSDQVGPLFT